MIKRFTTIVILLFFITGYTQQKFDLPQLKKDLIQKKDTALVSATINIGRYYLKQKNDSAFIYYSNAHNLAVQLNSEPHIAESYLRLGDYYEYKNKYSRAIENYILASSFFLKNSNEKRYAQVNNHLGINYLKMYAENKAIEHFLISVSTYKNLNDLKGIARNTSYIGHVLYLQENYKISEKYYNDALTIYKQLNDSLGISNSYTNLGNVYSDEGAFNKGLNYYTLSIKIQKLLKDSLGVAINYNNIGDTYGKLKKFKKANAYLSSSLKEAIRLQDKELEAIVLLNFSDINFNQKNYKLAIDYAQKSYAISKNINDSHYQIANLKLIGNSYDKLGDQSNALKFTKKYIHLKDSIYDKDIVKKNQLVNSIIELEKVNFTVSNLKEQQEISNERFALSKKYVYFLLSAVVIFGFLLILLVHQRTEKVKANNLLAYQNHEISKMNSEIKSQKDKLTELNATKDKFFSIIAHDLKNPFNSIKGFTELLIDNSEEYNSEKRLKFLNIIKSSTIKASNLLNNLLIWAHSQSGTIAFMPIQLNLFNQISNVFSLLEIQAVTKNIKLLNNVHYSVEVKADENMLNTILRNLISNAIKFTNQGGEIIVTSKINSDFTSITIEDNGIGMSPIEIETLFNLEVKNSKLGTENETGSGLGLILCKDFIEKNGGKIWVSSQLNVGSKFTFTIPLAKEPMLNSVI